MRPLEAQADLPRESPGPWPDRLTVVAEHLDPRLDLSAWGGLTLIRAMHELGVAVRLVTGCCPQGLLPEGIDVRRYLGPPRRIVRLLRWQRWAQAQLRSRDHGPVLSMSLLVRGDLNLLMSETERQRIALAAGSGEGTAAMLSRAMHLVHPGNAYRVAHEKSVLKHEGASVAAASRAIAEGLTGLASPAAVLPMAVPGVHMLGEATPALQAKVRQGLGIPSDAPLILFPSTRPRIDGFGPLMLALRMMRERGSGAIVLLAGSYRYTHLSWIAELGLREAVRFAGPTRRLGLLYAACDVVVHPTRGDGAGQAVLLAIAAGKPVVTTGGGVAAGLLEQAGARGAVQLLQADVSPDGIAEALDQALAAPDRVEWESTCRGLVEQWSPAGQARVVLNHLAGINSASALALDGD